MSANIDLKTFLKRGNEGFNLVPISRKYLGDLETPLSALSAARIVKVAQDISLATPTNRNKNEKSFAPQARRKERKPHCTHTHTTLSQTAIALEPNCTRDPFCHPSPGAVLSTVAFSKPVPIPCLRRGGRHMRSALALEH